MFKGVVENQFTTGGRPKDHVSCAVEVGLYPCQSRLSIVTTGEKPIGFRKSRRLFCIFSTRSCWKYKHPQSHQGYMRLSENRASSKLHLLSPSFSLLISLNMNDLTPDTPYFLGISGSSSSSSLDIGSGRWGLHLEPDSRGVEELCPKPGMELWGCV